MNAKVETLKDVKLFAAQLIREGLNFHPDDDFNDYINVKTGKLYYSEEEVRLRNIRMGECFTVCANAGADIYSIMHEVSLIETGMDKYIPLPSKSYQEN